MANANIGDFCIGFVMVISSGIFVIESASIPHPRSLLKHGCEKISGLSLSKLHWGAFMEPNPWDAYEY